MARNDYHVTAVRNGGVFGHHVAHCDESGICNGDERFLCPVADGDEVEPGIIYEIYDGAIQGVVIS